MFAELLEIAPAMINAAEDAVAAPNFGTGLGAGLAAGGAAIGAGLGIGNIGGQASTGIARQPDAADAIKGNALLLSALIEGVALFAAVVGLLLWLNT